VGEEVPAPPDQTAGQRVATVPRVMDVGSICGGTGEERFSIQPIVPTLWAACRGCCLMPLGIGVCPRCGTQSGGWCHSVFCGDMPATLRTQDELAQAAPVRCEPAAHVVFWRCWRCGRQFKTEAVLQTAAR
jgi:hypothetical protein